MAVLICVLVLGMLLGGPIRRGARAVLQAVNHFLLVGLLIVMALLLAASAGP